MVLSSVIRHRHFRQQIPIREIERRTGLSRKTPYSKICMKPGPKSGGSPQPAWSSTYQSEMGPEAEILL